MRLPLTTPLRVALAAVLVAAGTMTVLTGPAAQPAHAASATLVSSFGSNPGALRMFRYVPSGLPAGAPVVVAMHGCTQTALAYDEEPGWVALAERWKFVVVLPEQQTANNSNRCFNWFESGDISRGAGEALSIKQMVDKTRTDLGTSATRNYVTGLSAGGAMTSVMLATYPDVFAGGAVVAGLPYKCATTVSAAYSCMSPGVNKTPQAWGDLVRSASPYTGTRPTVQVWHGTSDSTVNVANMTELVDQFTNAAGADQTADVSDTVAGYPHKVYRDSAGRDAVQTYAITGMGHGTPVDPGTGTTQCGTAGAYILDVNICSSYYIATNWGLDTGGGTTPTPTPSPTPTPTDPPADSAATFISQATEDGYVKALPTGYSASVGGYEASYGIAVGRGADGQINKSLLSFDTSSIPDGATITGATVTVSHNSGSGDPWASPAGNTMVLDVQNGCFGTCSTEASDWGAAATAAATASMTRFTSGTRTSTEFDATGRAAISTTGRTQVRLRFATNPSSTAYVFVKSGASATLRLTWQ